MDPTYGYTEDMARSLFSALGINGKHFYLRFLLLFDSFHPLIVALFFSSLFLFLSKKAGLKRIFVLLLPIAALAADYGENIFLAMSLWGYPEDISTAIRLASGFTTAKFLTMAVYPLPTLSLFILFLISAIRKRKKRSTAER